MLGWLLLVAGGADVFCSDRWLDTTLEGKTKLTATCKGSSRVKHNILTKTDKQRSSSSGNII